MMRQKATAIGQTYQNSFDVEQKIAKLIPQTLSDLRKGFEEFEALSTIDTLVNRRMEIQMQRTNLLPEMIALFQKSIK